MKSKEFWVKQLGESWAMKLKPILKTDYMEDLIKQIEFDYIVSDMYPTQKKDIFKAFKLCKWEDVRVVVLGTDPSPDTGTGGLPFSDILSIHHNPSAIEIRNVIETQYGELYLDFDFTFEHWANQGILMLNRSFSCPQEDTKKYRELWKKFFGSIIYLIEKEKPGTIFLLWGKEARQYSELLSENHHVFSCEHPMKAVKENRKWECFNFKQIDLLIESKKSKPIFWGRL
jgi:uracil-DNA glycosylase